jgi:hypothetical protein
MSPANTYRHPVTLEQVATVVINTGRHYPAVIRELIDTLGILGVDEHVFAEESADVGDVAVNTHLAGIAELMALHIAVDPPEWCMQRKYFLREPTFLSGVGVNYAMINSTPSALSGRLLFCGMMPLLMPGKLQNN